MRYHVLICCLLMLHSVLHAGDVPSSLPLPDKSPGNPQLPVRVYILAGQSNMVGMGNLDGAKNLYDSVFLSSDPNIPVGPLPIYQVGNYRIDAVSLHSSSGSPTTEPLMQGTFSVPQQGSYRLYCGDADSGDCLLLVEGTQVFQRRQGRITMQSSIELRPDRRYTFQLQTETNTPQHLWMQQIDLPGYGDLESVVLRQGKFPWLTDGRGNWSVRRDVYFQEARLTEGGKGSLLSPTSNNGRSIGPELGFGHVMGTFHDEQVLLIKTAQGNRSLGFDFRPPSSGRTDPDNEFEAAEYRLMLKGVRETLQNIARIIPDYNGQGYTLSGFLWFQGHKDSFDESLINEYEQNLGNLIKDVRKDLNAPLLPVAIATVGFGGQNMQEKFQRIFAAQMSIGDHKKHPEFEGNVTTVDTRNFWREVHESPKSEDYHYNRNAETYVLIGDALGRAMVALQGGTAAPLPVRSAGPSAIAEQQQEPSADELVNSRKALRPIVLEGIAAAYEASDRHAALLQAEREQTRPSRTDQFLRGSMFGLVNCWNAIGVSEYDWHRFGPDLDQAEFHYFSFDPPETLPADAPSRFRKVTVPTGMEQWIQPAFDATAAGWKTGLQPFGQLDGVLKPVQETCTAEFCRCGETPRTLWQNEVLMIRTTVSVPALKPGHRYRVVLGGAAHVNSGEGFALYANGKLLGESKSGVAVRQGGKPRGAHIYADLRKEISDTEVTFAGLSFLRLSHPRQRPFPPRGHLSLRLEEQKLPPQSETPETDRN